MPISDISGAGTDHRQNSDIRIDEYPGQKDHVAVTLHYHDTVFAEVSTLPGPISNDTYLLQDISLIKNLKIRERIAFRFQTEFFNAWNKHIFVCKMRRFGSTAFDTDIAGPTFGEWNGNVSTPRNIQFAAKLLF